jgi:hypothetical protein
MHTPYPLMVKNESITSRVLQNSTYLGNMPSGSQGGKWKCRKNNDHWTQGEVIKLVDGVETYGVGRWTKVKSRHFPTSFRDPTHLKVYIIVCSKIFRGY